MTTAASEFPQTEIGVELAHGIYPGMRFTDYRKVAALNCSTLAWGKISMRHLRAAMDGRLASSDSAALAFGRAMHTRLLEPDEFEKRHPIMPDFGDMRSSKNRAERDHWAETLPLDTEPIDKADAAAIERCADELKNHPGESLRRARGEYEVVIVGELMGVKCKARLDKLIRSPLTVVDVKKVGAPKMPSAPAGDPMSFESRIANYGYGMQAAFYSDLLAQHFGGTLPRWYWIVVEDGEPFSVGVYRASDSVIKTGRIEYEEVLARYKSCQSAGSWPGFSADVATVYGPPWWENRYKGISK